ncbi:hypothetical protein ACXVWQ_10740, partial [Haemophilus sp. SZY H57]
MMPAPDEGSVTDILERIREYQSDRRRMQALGINKTLGGGASREPLWVSQDDLAQINLGSVECPKFISISSCLNNNLKVSLEQLLLEYKDIFAWDYTEMPGLDRKLVEHKLPIADGAVPVKQAPRRLTPAVIETIHSEVIKLFKAGYIRTAKYVEWISSIVPVIKKNG